jgi:hypothetical protein
MQPGGGAAFNQPDGDKPPPPSATMPQPNERKPDAPGCLPKLWRPSSMNYMPNETPARIEGASWQPPAASKPVQMTLTLNLDGRMLAQTVGATIADLHEFATGAPSSYSYADHVGPDNNMATT